MLHEIQWEAVTMLIEYNKLYKLDELCECYRIITASVNYELCSASENSQKKKIDQLQSLSQPQL